MKAAVYHGPGDIRVEDISDPKLEADGIVMQVKAAGICGSDIHRWRIGGVKEARMEVGQVLGHEFGGEVIDEFIFLTGDTVYGSNFQSTQTGRFVLFHLFGQIFLVQNVAHPPPATPWFGLPCLLRPFKSRVRFFAEQGDQKNET